MSESGAGSETDPMGPPEPYGPVPPTSDGIYGPEPIQIRPVVLVLGPGLARGYAYAGVLRALHEAKIPIGAIVGTEMGGLVGALYAMSGTINGFEWALLRFKEDPFQDKKGLLSMFQKGPSDGARIVEALNDALGDKDLKQTQLPLRVAVLKGKGGELKLMELGPAAKAIRAAISVPGLLTPGEWDGDTAFSAGAKRPFPVSEARLLGIGPVVLVDVLTTESAPSPKETKDSRLAAYFQQAKKAARRELKEADVVIQPDMHGIKFLDFEKKMDAAFRGKQATQSKLAEVRRWVGLPDEDGGVEPGAPDDFPGEFYDEQQR